MSTKRRNDWDGNVLTKSKLHVDVKLNVAGLGFSGYRKELTKFRANFIRTFY